MNLRIDYTKIAFDTEKVFNFLFWCWFITLIVLSVIPKIPESEITVWRLEFRIDYMEHLLFYFILGMLYLKRKKEIVNDTFIGKTMIILLWTVFAISSELVQKYVTGRTFNPNDMYYNIAGVALGIVVPIFYFKRKQKLNLKTNLL